MVFCISELKIIATPSLEVRGENQKDKPHTP